jgi:hypothetical protein
LSRAKPLAKKALDAVKNKDTKIIPEMWNKTYNDWLENIRDWCISRQIWWGHQIPAWTCQNCGVLMVAMEDPESCVAVGKIWYVKQTFWIPGFPVHSGLFLPWAGRIRPLFKNILSYHLFLLPVLIFFFSGLPE